MRANCRPTPLDGLRVVEISDRIAGSYCGKLFIDAGAQVRKIELGQGDPLRSYTACGSRLDAAASPLFGYLNAGKRSVAAVAAGPERVHAELAGADVVVLTATRAQAAVLGIDPQQLLHAAPQMVVVTISDFGWSGPYAERAASEFTLQAWSGLTGFRGDPAGPPIAIGGDLGEYMGGVYAAFGALAVRRRVERGGPGEHLDLSMLEAITAMQSSEWLHSQLLRVPPVTRTVEVPSIEPARDGFVGFTMVTGQQWLDFAAMVDCDELTQNPQLKFQIGRWAHRDRIRELIGGWLAERTVDEIVELGALFRLPVAALGTGATVRDTEYATQRGVFVPNPAGFDQPRPPWLMSRCRPAALRPAPALGDADQEPPWAPRAARVSATAELPLAGIRVIDLTAFWAGPAATHLFGAFGAEVIKVESIQRPDGIRYSGGMRTDVEDWWEYGWVFHAMNTNKRSVTLDLGCDEGRALLLKLVADADVVIENFSPRVMDQFGLDAESLLAVNPRLVVARMPAFGLDSPWRDRVGFAPTMEQIAGLAWVTGHPDGPPVAPRGACDPLAGVHAAFAVTAALMFAERTGAGQLVELPMVETVLNATAIQPIESQVFGVTLTRRGNRGHGIPLQNLFRCVGDDDWVAVTACTPQQQRAVADLAGAGGEQALAGWCASRTLDAAVQQLAAAGVPAAPVVSPSLVVDNVQLRDRGFFEELRHPRTGPGLYPRPPFAPLRGWDRWLAGPPPTLGEHNREVLGELCGCSEAELERLSAAGVIGTRPKGV